MIVGIQFTARYLICLLYGETYLPSVSVERVLSLALIISPVGYLLGSRVMLVSKQENKMAICVGAGAVVNVIGNFFLIRICAEMGAAIASVIGEIVVMTVYLHFGRKVFRLYPYKSTLLKVIIAAAAEAAVLFLCRLLVPNEMIRTILQIILGIVTYVLVLYATHDDTFDGYLRYFLSRILPRRIMKRFG